MSKIIVSVVGWCEADPEKVRFQRISDMYEPVYITGAEWLALPESGDKHNVGRDDYILECVGKAFDTALDSYYDSLEIEVEE
jgi:hypothetical protein